jgi:hypothetical protein
MRLGQRGESRPDRRTGRSAGSESAIALLVLRSACHVPDVHSPQSAPAGTQNGLGRAPSRRRNAFHPGDPPCHTPLP